MPVAFPASLARVSGSGMRVARYFCCRGSTTSNPYSACDSSERTTGISTQEKGSAIKDTPKIHPTRTQNAEPRTHLAILHHPDRYPRNYSTAPAASNVIAAFAAVGPTSFVSRATQANVIKAGRRVLPHADYHSPKAARRRFESGT